jgi:hypothetical protein
VQRLFQQESLGDGADPEVVVLPGRAIPDEQRPSSSLPTTTDASFLTAEVVSPPSTGAFASGDFRFDVSTFSSPTIAIPSCSTVSDAIPAFVNPLPAPVSAKDNARRKKKAKRAAARELAQLASPTPYLKGVGLRRAQAAVKRQIRVASDAAEFAHTVPAWIGVREPANGAPDEAPMISLGADVLEGKEYTQAEVDALAKTYGLRMLRWNGRCVKLCPIPIIFTDVNLAKPSPSSTSAAVSSSSSAGNLVGQLGPAPSSLQRSRSNNAQIVSGSARINSTIAAHRISFLRSRGVYPMAGVRRFVLPVTCCGLAN